MHLVCTLLILKHFFEDRFNSSIPRYGSGSKCWRSPFAEMCRGFLYYRFCGNLPGIFLEDFSGHFPLKREKIWRLDPGTQNPRKNPAAQKLKSAKNPFCQKSTLTSAASSALPLHHPAPSWSNTKRASRLGKRGREGREGRAVA